MADPQGTSDKQPPPRPTWVKWAALLAAVVIAVVVVMAVMGGDHGPSRHLPGRDSGGHTPPVQHSP